MTTEDTSRLGERYQMGGLLGRGGMADVRVGQDLRLGRTVAIKRLRSDLASDPTFQMRFRREAQSAASLNHPAIVAVYDTGDEVADDGSSLPYIVMEYIEGRTLREILREGRKVLPERALEITADVLSALDYSHRSGIVHRDIKPANVMLTPAGQIKVMDFGIARAVADASSSVTQTAAVVGTAQYLSPEQARGEQVDARSDIYSTGCLLYELLTGRPPFVGDSPVSVAYQHVREEAERPSHYNPDIPDAIDAIVAKSLAKRTDDRYQSAAEMRADVERFLAGQSVSAPAVESATTAVVPAALVGGSETETSFLPMTEGDDDGQPGRRRGLWIALALLTLALIAGAVFAVPRLLGDDEPQPDVSVPNVITMTVQDARDTIRRAGLTVDNVTQNPSDDVPAGRVIDQDPEGGTFLFADDPVNLVVSAGPAAVEIPNDLIGKPRQDAAQELEALGLRAEFEPQESDEPQGIVLSTDPTAGTEVAEDAVVTLTYSSGLPEIPNVVGLDVESARAALRAAGFDPETVQSSNTQEPAGTVIDQAPSGGSRSPEGTTVVLTVSSKTETTQPTTPTPPTTPTTEPTSEPPPPSSPTTKPTKSKPTKPQTP